MVSSRKYLEGRLLAKPQQCCVLMDIFVADYVKVALGKEQPDMGYFLKEPHPIIHIIPSRLVMHMLSPLFMDCITVFCWFNLQLLSVKSQIRSLKSYFFLFKS